MNLAICLKSKHTNWECIIVNDGSPDDTESVAQKWCTRDNRFKYLKRKRRIIIRP
jgi:glycosyltransferase involved in cell wall biosynthesis